MAPCLTDRHRDIRLRQLGRPRRGRSVDGRLRRPTIASDRPSNGSESHTRSGPTRRTSRFVNTRRTWRRTTLLRARLLPRRGNGRAFKELHRPSPRGVLDGRDYCSTTNTADPVPGAPTGTTQLQPPTSTATAGNLIANHDFSSRGHESTVRGGGPPTRGVEAARDPHPPAFFSVYRCTGAPVGGHQEGPAPGTQPGCSRNLQNSNYDSSPTIITGT